MIIKRKWCRGCKTKRAHVLAWYVNQVDICIFWNDYCGCAIMSGDSKEEAERRVPCHNGYTQQWTCGRCNKVHHTSLLGDSWTPVKEPGL